MADISLKYLTELTSATSISDDDLFHINQEGNDKSIAASVIKKFIVDSMYPANSGAVAFFAKSFNPNTQFPGTIWARVPGMGKTIRLANEGMDDVLNQGGADSFVIGADNLPNHTHDINLSTSTFDYGTKTTSTNGSHSHKTTLNREATQRGVNVTYGDESTEGADQIESSYAGEHTHSVSIGQHNHSVSGTTVPSKTAFPNTPVNSKNAYVNLIAWYRTA
ncbi:hypothetical protein [Escherichia coli]|uniref:hypothetical protein n=1 Tax=Escherichia coli TaxID=562 RepID=UPI0018114759|nr:hypothetical protein [Escherichia coli]EFM0420422.1 hypothetical protein [Escherichia coli]ELC6182554.1 hypothetical protein [Escherichia coli]